MNKFTITFVLLFTIFGFSQNQSLQAISTPFANPVQQFGGGEIFRFAPGIVTQLDLTGTASATAPFDFTTSRWFSLGRLSTGNQTVYGLRFQLPNKSLTLGYRDLADINPRLEWIGTGASFGNLEFRAANNFTSTTSNLVATMTNDGNTYFGDALFTGTKVGIDYKTTTGLALRSVTGSSGVVVGIRMTSNSGSYGKEAINIESTGITNNSFINNGITMNLSGGSNSSGVNITSSGYISTVGVNSNVKDSPQSNVGIKGTISNAGGFGAGIWGVSPTTNINWYAGLFDGKVVVNGPFSVPSDRKLKENIKPENGLLEKLINLNPVNYNFAPNDKINLPDGLQHGFLAQNIEENFPELVIPARKPIMDKEGKFVEYYDYKTVNYLGLISLLTCGIKELNDKVTTLEEIIAKESSTIKASELKNSLNTNSEFLLEQNVPNPFDNQTTINYSLPKGTNASLTIFDLSGKLIKDYALTTQKGQVIIQASDIGKGMFIYSLVSNNQEMISKKMIIK